MSHTIVVWAGSGGFDVDCSCGETLFCGADVTLDDLTRLADEHIERADRGK